VQQNGASIVVVDRYGQMVACGYTMVQPFGAGVLAPGTGILLVPADTGGPPTQPAALALVSRVNSQIFLGAAVSGASPATIAAVPLDTAGRGMTLERAIAAPRLFDPFDPDIVVHEPAWEPSALARLRELGYTLRAGESLARINGFHCPEGLPRTPSCQFVSDPRGFGLSASADR
jgi:gamma-glutamyltranspeptidase/glutathione hydrolase